MLQFIKGDNFAEYMQVIQDGTVDISEALFLDTVNHRLYLNGEALDVRINVIDEVGENFIKKINDSFEKHKCAQCGTIYEEAVDGSSDGFF